MKKISFRIVCILLILSGSLFASYNISQKNAQDVANNYPGELSEMRGNITLFYNGKICFPFWTFRGNFVKMMTGATFDMEVSLAGRIIKKPNDDLFRQ